MPRKADEEQTSSSQIPDLAADDAFVWQLRTPEGHFGSEPRLEESNS